MTDTIKATMTFAMTIIPLETLTTPSVQSTGVPLNPYGGEQLDMPVVNVTPAKFYKGMVTDTPEVFMKQLDKDMKYRGGDPWTCLTMNRPMDSTPITMKMVDFDDVAHLTRVAYEVLREAMFMTLVEISGEDISLLDVRNVIDARRIPSVGSGSMIWHPYMQYGNMKKYSVDDLLVRWALCFMFDVGIDTNSGKSAAYMHNHWRASTAQLPPCIYYRGSVGWGVSAPMCVVASECGKNFPHRSTITEKLGNLVSNTESRIGVNDANEFNFDAKLVLRLAPVKYAVGEVQAKRPYTVDSSGDFWSHDLVIADAVMQLKRAGRDDEIVVWTPRYMMVVSYTAPGPYGKKEYATVYLHSGVRPSRIAPSYHARKAVTSIEHSALKLHYASLGRSGALGYIEGLIRCADSMNVALNMTNT